MALSDVRQRIKIVDIVPDGYNDFLCYCKRAKKEFVEEITDGDYLAYKFNANRTIKEVNRLKALIGNNIAKSTGNAKIANQPSNDKQEEERLKVQVKDNVESIGRASLKKEKKKSLATVAKQMQWDKYESAYLLHTLIKVHKGEISRKEAIAKVSQDLRNRAVSSGMEIDDVFRNENGITWQMLSMEEYYLEGKNSNRAAPKIFKEIVKIYKECPDDFNKILSEILHEEKYSTKNFGTQQSGEIELDGDLEVYRQILFSKFYYGFRVNIATQLEKFINYLNDAKKTTLSATDDLVCKKTLKSIINAGIQYENYVYAPDSLLPNDVKENLLNYIDKSFAEGINAIYYQAVFDKYHDLFLEKQAYNMHDKNMLQAYLKYTCGGKYNFEEDYMSLDSNTHINIGEEIMGVMIAYGEPLERAKIYNNLPHIPKDLINSVISENEEVISDGGNKYFHLSLIDFSDDELNKITEIIQGLLSKNNFINGDAIIDSIMAKYPFILARFQNFSKTGLREAIACYLGTEFFFHGNIVSLSENYLTRGDVFDEYAKAHPYFTLDELKIYAQSMNLRINFDSLYRHALRISETEFVPRVKANFDIGKVDAKIASYCKEDYVSLSEIPIESLPSEPKGFPWTIYLLEQYVDYYSKKFKLVRRGGYGASKCAGAIVKNTSKIDDFDTLITDVLIHSTIELTKPKAIQYLYEKGYIAVRVFSNIEGIITKARAQKGVNNRNVFIRLG